MFFLSKTNLHSNNIFDIKILQWGDVRILPFVILDDNLLNYPVQK